MTRRVRPLLVASLCALLLPIGAAQAATTPTEDPSASAEASPTTEAPDAATAEVADGLAAQAENGPIQVLVAYEAGASQQTLQAAENAAPGERARAEESAQQSLEQVKTEAIDSTGDDVTVVKDLDNLPVQLVEVENADALADLAAAPGVLAIQPNSDVVMMDGASAAGPYAPYAVDTDWSRLIGANTATAAGFDGRGTRVAVIDSGINTVSAGGIAAFGDCSAGWAHRNCRVDTFTDVTGLGIQELNSHGTNVAGIITAVAPATQLDVFQVFRRIRTTTGYVETASSMDVLTALNQVTATASSRKIKAVNMSLGLDAEYSTSTCTSVWSTALSQVRAAGVVPVVAAGNSAFPAAGSFSNGISDPACASGVLSVGATYPSAVSGTRSYNGQSICNDVNPGRDQVACFSQSGPNLSMLAPGVGITAAGVAKSGTSQATPMVAGAIAAISSAARTATTDALFTAVTGTGQNVTDVRNGLTKKRLDVSAAATTLAQSPNQISSIGNQLASGRTLSERQRLTSANGQHVVGVGVLGMQEALAFTGPTCDAVVLAPLPVEDTNTLVMQTDGNLVLYGSAGNVRWASNTEGNAGAIAVIQDDRNFVVYSAAGRALWGSAGTCNVASQFDSNNRVLTSHTLATGQFMLSSNRLNTLVMQADGNLVLYTPSGAVWSSGTWGNPGATFVMQGDGNMVVYNRAGQAVWGSGTWVAFSTFPAYTLQLALQPDGNLVAYRTTGGSAWSTNTAGR